MKNFFKRMIPSSIESVRHSTRSYSQGGEDILVENALNFLGVSKKTCTYLDIGANHPYALSNTFRLYRTGARGVLVEPDPNICRLLSRRRPRDTILNVGVGFGARIESAILYQMSADVLNTFSEEEAVRIAAQGVYKVTGKCEIELWPLNDIMDQYFTCAPDLVSIDVEGFDSRVIRELDFGGFRPAILCIETLEYSQGRGGEKVIEIIEYIKSKDYFIYADTYINTIFIDRRRW